jgi:hypothetical protein
MSQRLSIALIAVLSLSLLGSLVGQEVRVPEVDDDPVTATCSLELGRANLPSKYAEESPRSKVWLSLLAIHVVEDGKPSATPVTGKYERTDAGVVFTPRFGFGHGVHYIARLHLPDAPRRDFEFSFKRRVTKQAVVEQIYPSGSEINENHLRWYVQFSQPIARGGVYDHIELRDANDELVVGPFLKLDEELWDAQQLRLTLLFDPGRVKRELRPRRELGAALIEGESYSLHVKATLRDVNGQAIKPFVKRFRVLAPDVVQPNPKRWTIESPVTPEAPVVVKFDESLDWAMLYRVIRIVNEEGDLVSGEVTVGQLEQRWEFQPRENWKSGRYAIRVDTRLEDPAGNSIGRPFEVDLLRQVERQIPEDFATRSFSVR